MFDPSGQWTGQYNNAGYWWGEYVRLGGRVLAFNSQSQGITVFLHKDMQTTTHMATGPSGSVLQDQIFYPWGQSWYNLGTWYQQEWAGLDGEDPSTGFYGSLSRSYNPAPGRWLSPDPAGLAAADPSDPQTWNMYAYVRNNPATLTDPSGLWIWGKCAGDATTCETNRNRFRDSVDAAHKSLQGLDPDSKEAKALKKTLDKLGEEGEGHVKVNFGDAGTDKHGMPNLGRTLGNNITINYNAVDSMASSWHLNGAESYALDAGLTVHERTHAGGLPSIFSVLGTRGEDAAYYNESVTYQGLHNTDKPFTLWDEAWPGLDQRQYPLEQIREQGIQHNVNPDTVPAPIFPAVGGPQ